MRNIIFYPEIPFDFCCVKTTTMTITKDKTVAQIVTENIKASHVFKKYNIDFCCGGGVTIEKVCEKNGVAYETLANDLLQISSSVEDSNDYNTWKLPFLIDYIVNIHHEYVEENLPLLLMYASKVSKVHGHHYSEVIEIDRLVREIASELSAHMKKEELILFPFIKQMVRAEKEGTSVPERNFGSVDNPIRMMEHEHEEVGDRFKEIARLTNQYTPPQEACNTFKALYDKLDEFEQDLLLPI